jgi:hypothetical protein
VIGICGEFEVLSAAAADRRNFKFKHTRIIERSVLFDPVRISVPQAMANFNGTPVCAAGGNVKQLIHGVVSPPGGSAVSMR